MKYIRTAARLFVGAVFILSGFGKAIDPLGTVYKLEEYFEVLHLDFLNSLSLVFAIILCSTEMIIGFNLLMGIRVRITSWFLLVFMSVFTLLTLKTAIDNKVTDCGCFGDMIILTNWQTFWKNIILFIPTLVIFLQRKNYLHIFSPILQWSVSALFGLMVILLAVYSSYHLPLLDFRPYKTGVNISQGMSIPAGSPVDEYSFSFIYKKNGVQKEFDLEHLPDSTWQWIETKQKLIRKGYVPPIHDFSITTLGGQDITQMILNDPGYTFLIIAYDLKITEKASFSRLNRLAASVDSVNIRFYCVTSSTFEVIDDFVKEVRPEFQICTADNITLKTMIRSNPGLMLLKKGTIIGKWHYRKIPEKMKGDLLSFSVSRIRAAKSGWITAGFITGFFLFITLIYLLVFRFCKKTALFGS